MAKNPKYFSRILSAHMEETPEGYLICRDVSICRSGHQSYFGDELKGFDGFEESWGLDPETLYKVYRPKDEVLHPETIKSFEGKTVVNEHPDGNVVHTDNDGELNCGHIQDVRQGPDQDGHVTLIGDMHIKDPDLRH